MFRRRSRVSPTSAPTAASPSTTQDATSWVGEVKIGNDIYEKGQVTEGESEPQFVAGEPVHVVTQLNGAPDNTPVTVVWYGPKDQKVREETNWTREGETVVGFAAFDTSTWKVTANVDAGDKPGRLALQADGKYLWVASASAGPDSGVTVIDAGALNVAAKIPTGPGPHAAVLSSDDRYAFVTNEGAGSVSIVDVRELKKLKDVATGHTPHSERGGHTELHEQSRTGTAPCGPRRRISGCRAHRGSGH